jgi:purine-binding chemotaxis protein CheW
MNTTHDQYLSLRVGSQWYAVPLSSVVEVHHMMMLTEHPNGTPNIIGLLTLRDRVFPIVDLRLCFGITKPAYRLDTPLVILRNDASHIGLAVDEADIVESVSEEQYISTGVESFAFVQGAVRLPDRLLLKLDVTALSTAFVSQ